MHIEPLHEGQPLLDAALRQRALVLPLGLDAEEPGLTALDGLALLVLLGLLKQRGKPLGVQGTGV